MGRYTGPKEKLSRREGINLFLKGERSFSQKAGAVRRPFAPGQHGNAKRTRLSNYGIQLREKQKVKRMYNLREKQFRNLVEEATRLARVHNTDRGLELLKLLEMRLDNIIYLLGLAASKNAARQYVVHNHVLVNGKKMTSPSFKMSVGDEVEIKHAKLIPEKVSTKTPAWIVADKNKGKVLQEPVREDIDEGIKENLIIEFYSR